VRPLTVPAEITTAMDQGAALAVSLSGGKDSQAMAVALVAWAKGAGYWGTNDIFAVHADLGRMEWSGEFATDPIVRRQARELGLRLEVVTRTDGRDLVDHIQARRARLEEQGKDAPFWPSSAARYCTSDLKRDPINKLLRQYTHIVSAEGIRADESHARAKKPCWQVRQKITTQTREAHTWFPILEWTTDDVWAALGTSSGELAWRQTEYRQGSKHEALKGWFSHPAYVLGNERLSCALCVLGSPGDILNGARHNPDLFAELLQMEKDSGWTFTQAISLVDIATQLEKEIR
jgi:3'-phosphoadenosine 5'-phosphosulfate sulfotransferase (PAPS reductase)/FAD synthetase